MGNKASSSITTEDIQKEFIKRLESDQGETRGYSNAPKDHLLAVRRWKHLRKKYPHPDWYDYHPNNFEKFSCAKITAPSICKDAMCQWHPENKEGERCTMPATEPMQSHMDLKRPLTQYSESDWGPKGSGGIKAEIKIIDAKNIQIPEFEKDLQILGDELQKIDANIASAKESGAKEIVLELREQRGKIFKKIKKTNRVLESTKNWINDLEFLKASGARNPRVARLRNASAYDPQKMPLSRFLERQYEKPKPKPMNTKPLFLMKKFQMPSRRPKITLAELKKLATKHKIKGRSKMNKAQLEKSLTKRVKSVRKKSRKPVKRKSRKPVKKKSRKPVRKKSRKPVRKKSRKPVKKKSRKPVKKKSRKRKSKFKIGNENVPTLKQIIYNKLPFDAKKEIRNNPDRYPVFSDIIDSLHREMMEVHAKKIRPKLKLTTGWSIPRVAQFGDEWSPLPKGLKLINILQAIYDHIISHPPLPSNWEIIYDDVKGDYYYFNSDTEEVSWDRPMDDPAAEAINYTLNAWDDFSNTNYPEYDRFEEKVIKWPKFMFLIYYTYKMSYRKYYNLVPGPTMRDYELPFNLHNNLMTYIYKTFNHLNESISLKEFHDFGY